MIPILLLVIITVFIPPVGVFLIGGCGADLLINICLTILGYFPGHIHAFYLEYVYYKRRDESRQGLYDNRPAQGVYSDNIQTGGRGYVDRWCFGYEDNCRRSSIELQENQTESGNVIMDEPPRGESEATRAGSVSSSMKSADRKRAASRVKFVGPMDAERFPPFFTETQDVPAMTANPEYVGQIARLFSEVAQTPAGPQFPLTR